MNIEGLTWEVQLIARCAHGVQRAEWRNFEVWGEANLSFLSSFLFSSYFSLLSD